MMMLSDSSPALQEAAMSRHDAEATYLETLTVELRMTLEEYFPGLDTFTFTVHNLEGGRLQLGWGLRDDGSLAFHPRTKWSATGETVKLETMILYLLWRILSYDPAGAQRLSGSFTVKVDELRVGARDIQSSAAS